MGQQADPPQRAKPYDTDVVQESFTPEEFPNGDALYRPIVSFENFGATWVADDSATSSATDRADSLKNGLSDAGALIRVIRVLARTAAAQTGAIELLYEISPGETLTVAMEPTVWAEAIGAKHDGRVADHIAVQVAVYEQLVNDSRAHQYSC